MDHVVQKSRDVIVSRFALGRTPAVAPDTVSDSSKMLPGTNILEFRTLKKTARFGAKVRTGCRTCK
jgi:hypothetical protein